MALWLFRRGSGRKRSRSGAALSDTETAPPRNLTGGIVRTESKRKQCAETAKLTRRARTYSFSPDRQDSIHVDRSNRGPDVAGQNGRPTEGNTQDPAWDQVPTLHHKRSSSHPVRRKSSKRRREDYSREAEIKAMSTFTPIRSATDAWVADRPMTGHKRAKTMGAGRAWDNPASELSLPIAASIHSTLSSDSEFVSYKISTLDSLAPRPTLRCAPGPRLLSSRASVPTRSGSNKRTLADRVPISEETLKAHKRVDDLADDFDAGELRELMERDARRQERHRQREREKMERRLARKAERQKKEEAEARITGTPPPENLERGVMGRELVGVCIDPPSIVVTSSKHRIPPEPMSDVEEEAPDSSHGESQKQPLESFHRTDTAPLDHGVAPLAEESSHHITEDDRPISTLPPSFKIESVLKSKQSKSGSTLNSDREKPASAIDDDAATRKDSIASGKTNRLSFTSFLRWGLRSRRNSGGPSSFSNTSREEMAAAAAAAQGQAQTLTLTHARGEDVPSTPPPSSGNYLASKPGSGVPKRTRSRFREDLPELPLSPPYSPGAEPPLPIVTEYGSSELETAPLSPVQDDSPASGPRPIDIPRRTGTSETMYDAHPAEQYLSLSLASIDSEASWLSGRVSSQRRSAIRDSINRPKRRDRDHAAESLSNSTQEDLTNPGDDSNARNSTICQSGEGRFSSDEDALMEDGEVRWGAVDASHPQLISTHRHDRDTFHSREGLLNIDSGDEEDLESPISPISPTSQGTEEKVDLQHARSVRVGPSHARNYSAGSAKLLDIGSPASFDYRNASQEEANGGQLHS